MASLWTPEQERELARQLEEMRKSLAASSDALDRFEAAVNSINETGRVVLPNLPTDCQHVTHIGNWHEGYQCQDCGTMLDRDGNPLEPVGDCTRCGNPEDRLNGGICQSCESDLLDADGAAVPSEGM